jgi:hypothetical protein
MIRRWAAAAFLMLTGCFRHRGGTPTGELLVFVNSGDRPFSDAIEVVGVDGGRAHPILTPERRRSYLFASGNSLRDPLVILVHQAEGDDSVSDRLYLYDPTTTHWSPVGDARAGDGPGVLSPDGRSVASIRGAAGAERRAGVWLFDLQNKTSTALIVDSPPTHWHASPAWRPNSKQIGLIDLRRGDRGLALQFVIFDLDSKREETVLSPAGAFCFSPDGTKVGLLTGEGVEVLSITSRERKLVALWSQLQARVYNGGGMSWSRYREMLAIGLFEKTSNTSEIWTVHLDGQAPKSLYSSPGRIRGLSFIDP